MRKNRRPADPWNAVMWAAERGAGLKLTAYEVWQLSQDDAIATHAAWLSNPPDAEQEKPED